MIRIWDHVAMDGWRAVWLLWCESWGVWARPISVPDEDPANG